MCREKKILLNKIDKLISERKTELLKCLPNVHEITDGFIVRFFTAWDNCEDDDGVKFKKIINHDNPDESVVFFFIPENTEFSLKGRFYIGCMTCLNGSVNIKYNNKDKVLENYSKICVESDDVHGKAYENTYLITTSNRLDWSESTKEFVASLGY